MDKHHGLAVLFDLDGTLLDTLSDLHNALNYALSRNGYPKRSIAETKSYVGNGVSKLILRGMQAEYAEDAVKSDDYRRIEKDFRDYYELHCMDFTKPYDGVLQMLSALRLCGIPTAVLSNKPDARVRDLCNRFFPGLLTLCAGEKEGVPKKPAPDGLMALLGRLQCPAKSAIYLGDSEVDVETAKNAGVSGIFVTWGFRTEEDLRRAGADQFLHSPCELLKLLDIPPCRENFS